MKVCYFGTYDVEQSRNNVIMQGLRQNGVEVVECHVRLWRNTADKIRSVRRGLFNPGLLGRALGSYFRLIKRYAGIGDYDVMAVGYAGHFDLFLAKLLTSFSRKPLVFDALLSLTETVVEDRGLARRGSLLARLVYLVDKYSCRLADLVLLDTEAHIQHFQRDFGVRLDKLRWVSVGADEVYCRGPSPVGEDNPFNVVYFGQYIPLHGVNHIVEAAKILEGEPDIRFELVGDGQTYPEASSLAERLQVQNVTFHRTWLSPEDLIAEHIIPADVCLGAFGDSPKARRVVPIKVFVALAMGKPVITGDSPAAREVLSHGTDAILCEMADPQALAQAILLLKRNRPLREKIAKEGYLSFQNKFSSRVIGATVKDYLTEVINAKVKL
ncbi:MAG: glycosyltransferase [Anaerolineales bacterium]|nr:glycosyltransferase [Anaerolineales bacterium]